MSKEEITKYIQEKRKEYIFGFDPEKLVLSFADGNYLVNLNIQGRDKITIDWYLRYYAKSAREDIPKKYTIVLGNKELTI